MEATITHPGARPSPSTRLLVARATFDRVFKEVLGIADYDLLLKALDGNGIVSLADVIALTDSQIDTLFFDDGTGARLPFLASRNKLRALRSWNFHLQLVQGRRLVDWMDSSTVNEFEWDDYRVCSYTPINVPVAPRTPRVKPATCVVVARTTQQVPGNVRISDPIVDPVVYRPNDGEPEVELPKGAEFEDTEQEFPFDHVELNLEGAEAGFDEEEDVFHIGNDCDMIETEDCRTTSGSNGIDLLHDQQLFVDCCDVGFATKFNSFSIEAVGRTFDNIDLGGTVGYGVEIGDSFDAIGMISCRYVEVEFGEPSMVFDPGGGDFGLPGVYDFSPPTLDQYYDLLLLDRGEL